MPAWSTSDPRTLPGYVLQLGTARSDRFDPGDALGERLRLVLVEGAGGVFLRGAEARPFQPATAFCLDEQEQVSFEGAGHEFRLLYFHPSVLHEELSFQALRAPGRGALPMTVRQDAYWLDPFLERGPQASGVFHPGPLAWDRILTLQGRIENERAAPGDEEWASRARTYLIKLLFFLRGLEQVGAAPLVLPPADDRVRELLVYLQASFDQRLTVEGLARRFATNRTTLQERFAAATGRTVMEFVTAIRIEVAEGLLRDTLLSIADIAARVGYEDATSFGRAFRKVARLSPSQYRERHSWILRARGSCRSAG